ncbi:hypothetical protein [Jiella sonneratiae]|uniref:Uncharacterized protein n=1 Tax=Jiella sonneratiae TaxID=2816856 RepID=A0ABS3J7K7_9HYPH|nr:hypothetical protein [Jiella sonneratiae]MBO0905658.1 hypothetical protein [Jiella sonneratiae]
MRVLSAALLCAASLAAAMPAAAQQAGAIGGGVQTGNTASPSATQMQATEGASTINSTNVDALARSGNVGTSAADSLGGSSDPLNANYSAQLSPGPVAAPRLPTPKVGIDLDAIRHGLAAAPSATPNSAGD